MPLNLASAGGGSITLSPASTASSLTVTVPAGTGTMAVNGVSTNVVPMTAVASTSGTSIDFTGIPSWVKRVTVVFSGVSVSGTSPFLVQIGSGSVTTTGYAGGATNFSGGTQTASTAGFITLAVGTAAALFYGRCVIDLITGTTYVGTSLMGSATTNGGGGGYGSGGIALGGALDRVRITTVNGTDTFDAGTINVIYE